MFVIFTGIIFDFVIGLSIVHGYVKSTGVNMLVSQLSNPVKANSGSGVFSANGKILSFYKSTNTSSKMLITSIPKVDRLKAINHHDQLIMDSNDFAVNQSSLTNFFTLHTDLTDYTFKAIDLNNINVTEKICVGSSNEFCCSIDVTLRVSSTPNYQYKLAIFNGGSQLGWRTVGIRTCALLACLNTSDSSCGLRDTTAPHGVTFEKIRIQALFPYIKNSHDQPTTLLYKLIPIEKYNFTIKTINNVTKITVTVTNQTSLLTFGTFGRVYDNDHKGTGPFDNPTIINI